MNQKDGFTFPFFYTYPPYFTLQPIKETRDKQVAQWASLVLSYCQHYKVYVLTVSADALWSNPAINRSLSTEGRTAVLDELVNQGRAEWTDKSKSACYIYWRKVDEWAAAIMDFVRMYGLNDSVLTLDELCGGDDVRGTDLHGLHRDFLRKALKQLEAAGKVRLFQGSTPEEEGAKFL